MVMVDPKPAEVLFRCTGAARRLPGVLGTSLLASVLLLAGRLDPRGLFPVAPFRYAFVLAGVLLALWIWLRGAEVRDRVWLRRRDLVRFQGGRTSSLPLERIVSLDWDPPFSAPGRFAPSVVLVDRFGGRHRICALLEDGDRFIDLLLERCPARDLEAWVDAFQIRKRIARGARWVAVGYLLGFWAVLLAVWTSVS